MNTCTAADGKTIVYNIPGYPLMVRAVDFNALVGSTTREEPTAEMVKDLMMHITFEDHAGQANASLWQSTSVVEKVIALKVLKAYVASRAAATAPAGGVTDDARERANFEAWADASGQRQRNGNYWTAAASDMWKAWKARAALTTAARAAEPAIHLGAEGQKVFAETLLNPPPPTAAFLKAEESYSNLVRPEATAPAGGMTEVLTQSRQALIEMATVCGGCRNGPDGSFCCRKNQWDAIQAIDALTTAARAAEPAYHCIGFIEQYGRMIGDTQQGKQTIPVYVRAASPTPPTGTSQGEGTS